MAKKRPTLDDFWGAGVTDELKDVAKHVDEIGKHLTRAADYDKLAAFFTWAARQADHDAVRVTRSKLSIEPVYNDVSPTELLSSDPRHVCSIRCDGQDGRNSQCAKERRAAKRKRSK